MMSMNKGYASRLLLGLILVISMLMVEANAVYADNGKLWIDANSHQPGAENKLPDIRLPSLSPLIEQLSSAVVNISIEGKDKVSNPFEGFSIPGFPGGGDNPFEYFNPKGQKERKFQSLGSGFVIHPDGYVVTNNHVVDKATKIIVTFRDEKQQYIAKIIGRDKKTDLALLKIDGVKNLTSVVLGDSDALKTGDWVIAIGNPFRLGHTATVGIVSAKSRHIPDGGPYDDYIQTDASINPGNSGGPLFNAKGEVVGVNTAIFSPGRMGGQTGFNIGIGFAIPVNIVKDIIDQLHKDGKVTRGWLGVLIQSVTPDIMESMALKKQAGALVADVVADSPAKRAGIHRGDVIVKFDGKDVEANEQLPLMVAQTPIGKVVQVVVVRQNEEKSFSVTIEELKDDTSAQNETEANEPGEAKLGMTVQELTPEISRTLGIDSDVKGVVVAKVAVDGLAAQAGLRPSDIILEVNSKAVTSVKSFRSAMGDIAKGKPALLLIRRGDNTIFLTLKQDED